MLHQATSLFKRAVLRGGSPYWYMRKYGEIALTLGDYSKRRAVARQIAAEARQEERRLVDAMNSKGFVFPESPLEFTPELVAACQQRRDAYLASDEAKQPKVINPNSKYFWKNLAEPEDISPDTVFYRFAMQESLYRLAAMYLGEAPCFTGMMMPYSFDAGGNPTHSQLWHRDTDDVRMFKVFVYCSDVESAEDGAFHVADRNAVHGLYALPYFTTKRFNDEQFFKIADREQTLPILGPAGTTFIADAKACFHYGSRCVRPRLACWFTYQSYAGLWPTGHVADPTPDAPEHVRMMLSQRLS